MWSQQFQDRDPVTTDGLILLNDLTRLLKGESENIPENSLSMLRDAIDYCLNLNKRQRLKKELAYSLKNTSISAGASAVWLGKALVSLLENSNEDYGHVKMLVGIAEGENVNASEKAELCDFVEKVQMQVSALRKSRIEENLAQ